MCGTGIFTATILEAGARVLGLERSIPMLRRAMIRNRNQSFLPIIGDMQRLPFIDASFDKVASITAIHFRKNDDPDMALKIEEAGREAGLNTGAFLAIRWIKPD